MPIGVVPHGADTSVPLAPLCAERKILVFGRLYAYKGVDTALAAVESLSEELPDVELIVAGRGPYAALSQGRRNVHVKDEYISDAHVGALLERVRLVLLPYKDATASGVGAIAIARGVPCVVSRVGSLPELVPANMQGLIVAPDDPHGLAKAIALHIDHDSDLRQTIREHAASNFAWPVVAARWCTELRRLGLDVSPRWGV